MIRRTVNLFVVGLCVAFASRAAFAQEAVPAAPAGPAPHIKFDATEVNLGDVVRGEDAVATFTYHNTGGAPLHILSAKPG
jgi:hypothetical protein